MALGSATYNGLDGYGKILNTSPQYHGPTTAAGASNATGAYFKWGVGTTLTPLSYPPSTFPGVFLSPVFCAPIRFGLLRGMFPIAGTGA